MTRAPFEFTSTIHAVTVDVSDELIKDTEAVRRKVNNGLRAKKGDTTLRFFCPRPSALSLHGI